jgi:hypothetical protein
MRGMAAFVIAAAVLAGSGFAVLGVARLEGHMADAQERAATQQYAGARDSLAAAEQYAGRARWIPLLGGDTRQEIRARGAALQYWQREYDAVLPSQAEPVAAIDESNAEWQLVVANALHRRGQGQAKDKTATLQSLEEAAAGYLTVLRNNTWQEDAAYNYEYIVRLRDELAKGKNPPPQPPSDNSELGEGGAPTPETTKQGFEIYVPLQNDEKSPSGGDAGKASTKDRKG